MESISNVDIPLSKLVCDRCMASNKPFQEAFTGPCSLAEVEVDGGSNIPPVMVTLDVQRISWRREAAGRYTAFAIISFPCPDCDKPHLVQHQLSAPYVFIRNLIKCKNCNGTLEIEDEILDYSDTSQNGPYVELNAKLICKKCSSVLTEHRYIPSPSFATLKQVGEIDIDLTASRIKPRNSDAVLASSGHFRFNIALTFPSQKIMYVRQVAAHLEKVLATNEIFYYENFAAELARPDLDVYLQKIYTTQSRLVVVFLCPEYEQSEWCGLEWRAIRELLKSKKSSHVMLMSFGSIDIAGLFSYDGYANLNDCSPEKAAMLIKRRYDFEFGNE